MGDAILAETSEARLAFEDLTTRENSLGGFLVVRIYDGPVGTSRRDTIFGHRPPFHCLEIEFPEVRHHQVKLRVCAECFK